MHLRVLTKREQQIILDEVDRQLKHQPSVPTKNRKRLRPNLVADWELRIGNLRVYYVVSSRDCLLYRSWRSARKLEVYSLAAAR